MIPAGGELVMLWWYPIARDIVIGVFFVSLIVLLLKHSSFLGKQVDVLKGMQESLLSQANTLKTYTDQFLALFQQLSPEKHVTRVKAIEELLEKQAKTQIAEAEREVKKQLDDAVREKQTQEQKAKGLENLAHHTAEVLSEASVLLGLALYELPKHWRETILSRIRSKVLKTTVEKSLTDLETQLGASPADQPPVLLPGELLRAALLSQQPPSPAYPVPPIIQRAVESRHTDPTPGTPKDPGGFTRTSP